MTRNPIRLFFALCAAAPFLAAQPDPQRLVPPGDSPLLQSPTFPQQAFFRQYFGKEIPRVDLLPPVRFQDFLIGDKLELSLRSYLELVLANNTDVTIQRLSVERFKNAITRSYGRFDPQFFASFSAIRARQQANSIIQGANVLSTLNQPFAANYSQTLESGTDFQVGFNARKTSTNDAFTTFNPAITSALNVQFSQPLWRNRGSYVNRIPVMIASSRLRRSEYDMKDQLIQILQRAELAYWQVVQMREFLRVQEGSLQVAGEFLKRSQRELELGAISALDIYQPQQNYANAEVRVTQARYQLQQAEDQLRRQMAADLDPEIRNLPIVLTETVQTPSDDRPLDKELYVETAYQKRPDLRAQLQDLDVDDLNYQQAKNALKPDFALTGQFTSNGRGGNFIPRSNNLGTGITLANQLIPGGFGDALNYVFGFDFPTYQMGLQLRLPLRNRAAQADLADAVVSKRLNSLRARNIQQAIRQDVLNAVTRVESSRAGVKLAQVALDFSLKRLDAEQKRYDLGVSTIFLLIQAQQDLISAQAEVVTQSVQYRRDLLNLERVTGNLLESRGVVVE
ncbi:MAG: TolC family protein [Bryobacteraceae bacterium]